MAIAARDEVLEGATYKVVVEDRRIYVTVNEQNGEAFEIFVRCDIAELYEWITLVTLLVTRLLRTGAALAVVAKEMQQVHSSASSLHVLKDGSMCRSIVARLGDVLAAHAENSKGSVSYE